MSEPSYVGQPAKTATQMKQVESHLGGGGGGGGGWVIIGDILQPGQQLQILELCTVDEHVQGNLEKVDYPYSILNLNYWVGVQY